MAIEQFSGSGVNPDRPREPSEPEPRAPRSRVDEVYANLVELLLGADVEPGERLRIDALARAWRVSQTPVREALARAEASGLVTREPLRGYRVAPLLSADEFAHLMEARLLIEPYCAARVCELGVAPSVVVFLEAQLAAMEQAPTGPTPSDYRDFLQADIAFHEAIVAASGNRFLQAALAAMGAHAHRFRRFSDGTVVDAEDSLAEHVAILAALRAGDADAARSAMYRHVHGVEQRAWQDPGQNPG